MPERAARQLLHTEERPGEGKEGRRAAAETTAAAHALYCKPLVCWAAGTQSVQTGGGRAPRPLLEGSCGGTCVPLPPTCQTRNGPRAPGGRGDCGGGDAEMMLRVRLFKLPCQSVSFREKCLIYCAVNLKCLKEAKA